MEDIKSRKTDLGASPPLRQKASLKLTVDILCLSPCPRWGLLSTPLGATCKKEHPEVALHEMSGLRQFRVVHTPVYDTVDKWMAIRLDTGLFKPWTKGLLQDVR